MCFQPAAVKNFKYRKVRFCQLDENTCNAETSVDDHLSIKWPGHFIFLLCPSVLREML
jgi:hypothetical protein